MFLVNTPNSAEVSENLAAGASSGFTFEKSSLMLATTLISPLASGETVTLILSETNPQSFLAVALYFTVIFPFSPFFKVAGFTVTVMNEGVAVVVTVTGSSPVLMISRAFSTVAVLLMLPKFRLLAVIFSFPTV